MVRSVVRRALLLGLLVAGAACGDAAPVARTTSPIASRIGARWLSDLDTLITAIDTLRARAMRATPESTAVVQASFVEARHAYKRVEYLVEHFTPATAEGINGPVLPKMAEDDPNQVEKPPEGFQVVEEYLFPVLTLDDQEGLASALDVLLANVRRARYNAGATPLTDAVVLDAVRMQLARLTTLALAGFDSPVAQLTLEETAVSLDHMAAVLAEYEPSLRATNAPLADTLPGQFARAIATLRAGAPAGFAQFDHLTFLVDHAEPLSGTLLAVQQALDVVPSAAGRAWRPDAASLFVANAFDAGVFAPQPHRPDTPAEVALGRRLFFDGVLSRDGTRACASCHLPAHAFADTARVSFVSHSAGNPVRNTPPVLNSALQGASFADLRTTFLEDQVADVVGNADEMHGSLDAATAAVAARPDYAEAFRQAFADTTATPVSSMRLRRSLAAYLRSLEALDARFDRYVRGDRSALTAQEQRGFNVFMGKGKCGTCHFAPLFNGTIPPLYQKTESEVLGVPATVAWRNARIDPDEGRQRITRLPIHQYSFKTPTLRNIALTAPYMHNGVYRTLAEVVDFYDAGGGAGIGIALQYQTLPPDSLHLTTDEKAALVAFMGALTDTTSVSVTRPSPIAMTRR